jgi:N-acetylmuramoyl-L-alanine amidase
VIDLIDSPSPNYSARPHGMPIDMLIMHYTGMPTGIMAIERLCDAATNVSAHYVVEEDGTIYRLVAETHRAHHAGESFWGGQTGLNDRAIGIEIVNPGLQFGYTDFPQAQLEAVLALAHEILSRHPIPPERVLGHSDVAPVRRWYDPGEKFPWKWFAENGVGIWPDNSGYASGENAQTLLARYGYETGDSAVTCCSVAAFQRHFRPGKIDGVLDKECHAILDALCHQVGALDI